MSIHQLKQLSTRVRDNTITASEFLFEIRDCNFYDHITVDHVKFLHWKCIAPLDSSAFWQINARMADINSIKDEWKILPVNGTNSLMLDLTHEIMEENYVGWNGSKHVRQANGRHTPNWLKQDTNFSTIPVHTGADAFESFEILFWLDELALWPACDLYCELVCAVCTNYSTCGWTIHNARIAEHVQTCLHAAHCAAWHTRVDRAVFYAMYIMKHEETVCTSVSTAHRFMLTLEKAERLQHYSRDSLLVNNTAGSAFELVAPYYLDSDRRLVSITEFNRRFDLVVDPAIRKLRKWKNVAVVGSTLVSCICDNVLLNTPGVEGATRTRTIEYVTDKNFIRRHNLYYPASNDIDQHGRETGSAMVSDLDIAVSCAAHESFDLQALAMIDEINSDRADPYTWCAVATQSRFKYVMRHPRTHLTVEIFHTTQSHPELVAQFHVAAVRMFYTFDQIYMMRSCAAALITGIGENYNWFSTNKNPIDILLKYAQRGYTTILNHKELQCVQKFLTTSTRWNVIPAVKTSHSTCMAHITGVYNSSSTFFRVDAHASGIRLGLRADTSIYHQNLNSRHTIQSPARVDMYNNHMLAAPHGLTSTDTVFDPRGA